MTVKRKRITKEERAKREQMMACVEMAHIAVLRRMFDAGWSDAEVGHVYRQSFSDCAELFLQPGYPEWSDEVASMVFCHYEKER
jgi:hypothetical protein